MAMTPEEAARLVAVEDWIDAFEAATIDPASWTTAQKRKLLEGLFNVPIADATDPAGKTGDWVLADNIPGINSGNPALCRALADGVKVDETDVTVLIG